jgi:hypothetical protein
MSFKESFDVLVKAALANERCPMNARGTFITSHSVSALAHMGWIKVEISGHNWRSVTILEGPHRGASTKHQPHGWLVYKIVDKNGTRVLDDEGVWRSPDEAKERRRQNRRERERAAAELARQQRRPWP